MSIKLGVDTLCYHCRIAAGHITVAAVLRECADLGADFVQVNDVHVRGSSDSELGSLRGLADELGLGLTFAGDMLGSARANEEPEQGAERILGWIRIARLLGSPYMRTSSGFYRAELWRQPEVIAQEKDFVLGALRLADQRNETDLSILLENHSDFTPEEYVEIIEGVGSDRVGVFLDLINPVSTFSDPLGTVLELLPWATAGHIKDFRLVSNYVPDRQHRRGFDVQWCYPGEGVADLPALVGALGQRQPRGDYLLSIEGLDNYADVADQRERLTSSIRLTRDLVAAV